MVSSMSTNARVSVPASSRGTAVASPVRTREWMASSCRTCPNANVRRNVPNVDGARTTENTFPMPPWRSTSRSSMQSAPASMPATTLAAFGAAFGDETVRCSVQQVVQAGSLGQSHHREQPGRSDQVRSSKTAETLCDACT